jgi:hypothetical protein
MIRTLSKIAIVVGDPGLADQVAAHFRRPLEYVVVFDSPRAKLLQYGHFENDCIRITNAIRTQRPQAVIFVGCTALVAGGIRGRLPKKLPVIELTDYDQVLFHHLPGFHLRPLEVLVSTEATAFDKDVIAVEDGNPTSLLIAKNLTSALGASLFLMPYVSDRAWKDNVRLLRQWANDNDSLERENARVSLF